VTDDSQSQFRVVGSEELRRLNEDVLALRRVQDELREDWYRLTELTPMELVRAWIAIVAIVEVGYDGEWEEYTNDLMTREFIAELSRRLPGRWATRFAEWVAPWDERFRAATTEESEPHLFGDEDEPGWWWYRTPRTWLRPDYLGGHSGTLAQTRALSRRQDLDEEWARNSPRSPSWLLFHSSFSSAGEASPGRPSVPATGYSSSRRGSL
jgi:hypothetical protein